MIRAAQSVTKEWSEAVNAKKQQRTAAETLEKAAADLPVKEKAKAEAEQALALFEKEKPKQKERIEMKGKLSSIGILPVPTGLRKEKRNVWSEYTR